MFMKYNDPNWELDLGSIRSSQDLFLERFSKMRYKGKVGKPSTKVRGLSGVVSFL